MLPRETSRRSQKVDIRNMIARIGRGTVLAASAMIGATLGLATSLVVTSALTTTPAQAEARQVVVVAPMTINHI